MDRVMFREKFNAANPLTKRDIFRSIRHSIEASDVDVNPRGHRNLIIVIEELAELQQEITKELRERGDHLGLIEELADAQLGIFYVQEICGISDLDLEKAMAVKIGRLESVLHSDGQYK